VSLVRADTASELDTVLAPARARGEAIAFVPTMGALHEGHLELVRRAAAIAPTVVVSIFVNPTQFDRAADLAAYPRDLAADLALLAPLAAGGHTLVVHAPDVAEMYPDGPVATLHVAGVGDHLCGATRPGHFDGVATVVDLLLRRVRPTVLLLGRKDFQQVAVVRRMIADRGHAVRVEAVPTVRGADGVAVSSRNELLTADGRRLARLVPHALAAGVEVARAARTSAAAALDPAAVVAAAARVLTEVPYLTVDYLVAADPDTIVPVVAPVPSGQPLLLAVAVLVPGTGLRVRLIDNVLVGDAADEQRLRDAVRPTSGGAQD